MPTNIQYRLQQYESVPPAESWVRISERLNEECLADEMNLSQKLGDYTEAAPAGAWDAILDGLDKEQSSIEYDEVTVPVIPLSPGAREEKREAQVIPFRWRRIAVAAMIFLAVSSYFYFVRQDNRSTNLAVIPVPGSGKITPSRPPAIIADEAVISRPPVTSMSLGGPANLLFRKRRKVKTPVEQASYPAITDNTVEVSNPDINYAKVEVADPVVNTANITIPTQPIRDGNGKIIMDEKLISAPDGNYVTVTCPNGQQTKISKKFLHALSYMNSGSADDEYMGILLQESSLWKWVFQEWRQKLLTQPSFIPSATNFLDIMELKEILHENF